MACPGMGYQGRIFSQDHDETANPSTAPDWNNEGVGTNDNVVYEEEIESESVKETINSANFAGLNGSLDEPKEREKDTIIAL